MFFPPQYPQFSAIHRPVSRIVISSWIMRSFYKIEIEIFLTIIRDTNMYLHLLHGQTRRSAKKLQAAATDDTNWTRKNNCEFYYLIGCDWKVFMSSGLFSQQAIPVEPEIREEEKKEQVEEDGDKYERVKRPRREAPCWFPCNPCNKWYVNV